VAERAVADAVRVPLRQGQFDPLVSFVFNIGPGAFQSSTLLRKFNRRDERGAADELLRWSRAGGRVLDGLLRRRRAERALFLSAPRDPHASLARQERRLVEEYDRVRRGASRRGALRRAMKGQIQRVRQAAQQPGWTRFNRRARYRALLERTR
jgi:hypothetical protein